MGLVQNDSSSKLNEMSLIKHYTFLDFARLGSSIKKIIQDMMILSQTVLISEKAQ